LDRAFRHLALALLTPEKNLPLVPSREKITQYIKDSIIQGKFMPGERIVEAKLARDLGAGRSVVRESLRYLEQGGFLEIVKHKGAVVKELSQTEIMQNYDIMGVLEGLAVRIAVPMMTDEDIGKIEKIMKELEDSTADKFKLFDINYRFHTLLASLSRNDRLISLLNTIYAQTRRSTLQSFYNQEQVEVTIKEHREIFEGIQKRDALEVETLIREHYQSSKNRLLRTLNRTL
jgi:DNA-binding GntR family transcriptional regulator